jgi:hypothetical protein
LAPVQPGDPGNGARHEGHAGCSGRGSEPTRRVPDRVELPDDRRPRTAGTVGNLGDDVEVTPILERRPQVGGGVGGVSGDELRRRIDQGVALIAGKYGRPDLLTQPWVEVRPDAVVDDVEDLQGIEAGAAEHRVVSGRVPAAMRSAKESTALR